MAIIRFFKMSTTVILNFRNFNGGEGQEDQTAPLCQISWKSVEPRAKYNDFSIFQDGGRRHLGFLKFQIFNCQDGLQGQIASSCQISSKSVIPRPRCGYFQIFQDGGRRHLGFSKF